MAQPTEWDALNYAIQEEERKALNSRIATALGPDLSGESCQCGRFGPWGYQGQFFCETHVPPELRFRGQFFAEMGE